MTFLLPGGVTPSAETSIRHGIFSIDADTLDTPMIVRADRVVIDGGRVSFLNDIPGRRDFLVASFLSENITAIREVEQ